MRKPPLPIILYAIFLTIIASPLAVVVFFAHIEWTYMLADDSRRVEDRVSIPIDVVILTGDITTDNINDYETLETVPFIAAAVVDYLQDFLPAPETPTIQYIDATEAENETQEFEGYVLITGTSIRYKILRITEYEAHRLHELESCQLSENLRRHLDYDFFTQNTHVILSTPQEETIWEIFNFHAVPTIHESLNFAREQDDILTLQTYSGDMRFTLQARKIYIAG
ncbi:MAG: hypothetical protein FWC89_09145 [Defluviitaleaceae bacterium]|nr:hypothetical protein [Defluviitaleaceae bacterium]